MTQIPNLVSTQLTTSEILFLSSICNPRYKSPVADPCIKGLHPIQNSLSILSCFPWVSGKPGISLPKFCMFFFPEEPRWSVMGSRQTNRQINTEVYVQRKPRDTQTKTQIKPPQGYCGRSVDLTTLPSLLCRMSMYSRSTRFRPHSESSWLVMGKPYLLLVCNN